jgi:hypothetical protein
MQLHLLALQSELVDGVFLILDGTDLETPPPQCQHQHLPYLAEHKTLVSRRMTLLCLSLLVDLAMCTATAQALQPQKLCLTHKSCLRR